MAGIRRGPDPASLHHTHEPHPHLKVAEPAEPLSDPQLELLSTIESEVIPRLRLAHQLDPQQKAVPSESRPNPTQEEIHEFARIATCHDLNGALQFVERLCREGLSIELVLLELVAPAARLLGEMWKADLRTFTEVTAGLGTLQQVVHVFGPGFSAAQASRGLVVLVPAPGEQHTLGLHLVGEFFRRAGWGVQIEPGLTESDLLRQLASERVSVLGFTISNEELIEALARLIARARKVSKNPDLLVMVGGSLQVVDLAERTGASFVVADAREAVKLLERAGEGLQLVRR
jgi:MerR family transcriptional regulator, light-induced transcriptional regulator